MKCKACNGAGYITACVYESDEIGFVDKNYECGVCHGTGQIEQNEEEWLKSLDTKQFAKWLDNLLMRCLCRDCNFCPIHKEPHCTCEGIEEWLKQPHREIGK